MLENIFSESLGDNTTAVYLIDDADSPSDIRENLKFAFMQLLATHGGNSTIRIAALAHGGSGSPTRTPLNRDERITLGGSNYPDLFGGFKAPGHISPRAVTNAIDNLTLSHTSEFLYPGIELARQRINLLCSGSSGAWCQRRIIVILGDGIPGKAADEYFETASDELPKKLLQDIDDDGIELHLACIGVGCRNDITRVNGTRYYYDSWSCPGPPDKCILHNGITLSQGISKLVTVGKYYW